MIDYSDWTTQRLREEFWKWQDKIEKSRELPVGDTQADLDYAEAREELFAVAGVLMERYDDRDFEMDGKPWTTYI